MNGKYGHYKEFFKSEDDLNVGWVMLASLFALIFFSLSFESPVLDSFGFNNKLQDADSGTLLSLQLTITFITISVFSLLINNINDRILNCSIKRLFFKTTLYSLNIITGFVVLMILSVASAIYYFFDFKLPLCVSFFMSLLLICWIIYLCYVLLIKKSIIYHKIISKMEPFVDRDFVKYFYGKVNEMYSSEKSNGESEDSKIKVRNSYIAEDLLTLYVLSNAVSFNIDYFEKGNKGLTQTNYDKKYSEVVKNCQNKIKIIRQTMVLVYNADSRTKEAIDQHLTKQFNKIDKTEKLKNEIFEIIKL